MIDNYIRQGIQRFIVCVGYYRNQLINYLKNRNDCEIIFSIEKVPLGTAGALKNAERLIRSDPIIVINGDSYIKYDVRDLINAHIRNKKTNIVLSFTKATASYGLVNISDQNKILSFDEKQTSIKSGWINTGNYIFSKSILDEIPPNINYSLENQLFPMLVSNNLLIGYRINNQLIDIGTPERYKKANFYFKKKIH